MSTQLEPVDIRQCQAETIISPSFMSFGGTRKRIRCDKQPIVIATEAAPRTDGQRGAMSLCVECLLQFQQKMGLDYATYEPIKQIAATEAAEEDGR